MPLTCPIQFFMGSQRKTNPCLRLEISMELDRIEIKIRSVLQISRYLDK